MRIDYAGSARNRGQLYGFYLLNDNAIDTVLRVKCQILAPSLCFVGVLRQALSLRPHHPNGVLPNGDTQRYLLRRQIRNFVDEPGSFVGITARLKGRDNAANDIRDELGIIRVGGMHGHSDKGVRGVSARSERAQRDDDDLAQQ